MAKTEAAAKPEPKAAASKVSRGVVAKKESKDADEESASRARKYAEGMKIVVLNKENPSREGSNRAKAFADMLKCKTVGDYYATGHKLKYLKVWGDSGHIQKLDEGAE